MPTRREVCASLACLGTASISARRTSCANPDTVFENKAISAGDNYPPLDMRANRLTGICVALHRHRAPAAIESDLGLSPAELRGRLDSLVAAALVKRSASGVFLPDFVVVTLDDEKWMAPPREIVEAAAAAVADRLPAIRTRAESIPAIRRGGFGRNAFLLLSDVLLDNWQIRNVESKFLNAERPLRAGRRYYYAIFEKPAHQCTEAFGIYGNGGLTLGNVYLGVYGNRRYDGSTPLSTSKEKFLRLFDFPADTNIRAELGALLARVVSSSRTREDRLTPAQKAGLGELGLFQNGELCVPLFSRAESLELGAVAALFTPDLLGLLERHRAALLAAHERSPYQDEASFNEFFMWWYHFFYSAVTDQLARKGLLEIPPTGNVTYLIAD